MVIKWRKGELEVVAVVPGNVVVFVVAWSPTSFEWKNTMSTQ